jgi:hypothetical protein
VRACVRVCVRAQLRTSSHLLEPVAVYAGYCLLCSTHGAVVMFVILIYVLALKHLFLYCCWVIVIIVHLADHTSAYVVSNSVWFINDELERPDQDTTLEFMWNSYIKVQKMSVQLVLCELCKCKPRVGVHHPFVYDDYDYDCDSFWCFCCWDYHHRRYCCLEWVHK